MFALLQDKAPVHTAQFARIEATYSGFELLQHHIYSQDEYLFYFFLFPKFKCHQFGHNFGNNVKFIGAVEEFCRTCTTLFFCCFVVFYDILTLVRHSIPNPGLV